MISRVRTAAVGPAHDGDGERRQRGLAAEGGSLERACSRPAPVALPPQRAAHTGATAQNPTWCDCRRALHSWLQPCTTLRERHVACRGREEELVLDYSRRDGAGRGGRVSTRALKAGWGVAGARRLGDGPRGADRIGALAQVALACACLRRALGRPQPPLGTLRRIDDMQTRNMQHAARNVQHAMCNTQRVTCNSQHATDNTQRATHNMQHATHSMQHTMYYMQLATARARRPRSLPLSSARTLTPSTRVCSCVPIRRVRAGVAARRGGRGQGRARRLCVRALVCACACACACVRLWLRACTRARALARGCACVRACVRACVVCCSFVGLGEVCVHV
jgi:hypothetical protein